MNTVRVESFSTSSRVGLRRHFYCTHAHGLELHTARDYAIQSGVDFLMLK